MFGIKTFVIIVINIFLLIIKIECIDQNSTLKDYVECEQYDVNQGYNYIQYYKIEDINHERDNETILNLKLGVLAIRDAHILLSTAMNPGPDDPVYEIVLGAGSNTFCEIRRFKKKLPLKTKSVKNVLSAINPTPINIKIMRNGKIEIFIIGSPFPLLSYDDPAPIEVNYLSFTSWGTAEAKWFFDCPDIGGDKMYEDVTPIPAQDRLIHRFIGHYNELPDNQIPVKITVDFITMNYNEKLSVLKTNALLNIIWNDPRTKWNSSDFENISMIRHKGPLLWIPEIFFLNSKKKDIEAQVNFISFMNGTNIALYKISLDTWCTDNLKTSTWPYDENECDIVIASDKKYVKFLDESNIHSGDTIDAGDRKWHVYHILRKYNFDPHYYDLMTKLSNNYTTLNGFTYKVYMKRNHNLYSKMFYTPLIVSLILLMFGFWIDNPYRMGIILIPIMILTVTFVNMIDYAPLFYVPTLMKYYNFSFTMAWISLIFNIITSWLTKHPPETPPPNWILLLMDQNFLRLILFIQHNSSFDYLNACQRPWIEVCTFLSRIFFLIYGCILSGILIKGI